MSAGFKFFKWYGKKALAFLVLTAILALTIVGATLAFIITYTDSLTNVFTPATVEVSIENGTIKNTGDAEAYVRAAVVVTWESTSSTNTINATAPKEGADYDYTVTYDTADWNVGSDGFYYYLAPLAAGTSVKSMPAVTDTATTLEGYKLSVEILADVIQSTPAEAVTSSWNAVSAVDADGKLVLTETN